ncbi:queuosine biosynthesis protein QueD [Legionella wadsworthii]|uniref:6-carboxy-5,6,7,8-tetrahydropterin synthase n=1 Tax=Legionella wadsworthii TaxID=28088 RepID=A0A378LUL8_9GAMM|nr:6-carboxytetrahydropterin synthase [Legionella wadsworthii]STY29519.1 queuosine biosynthesis protein QueD [Legionella wadsworthii]
MHSLIIRKDFIAQHFLIGKDFGFESSIHSHNYGFELEIENALLNQYNFLVDVEDINKQINTLIDYFQDRILNDLPEFKDQNPSLEFFSKILWKKFNEDFFIPANSLVTVRLSEDRIAQAAYREIR